MKKLSIFGIFGILTFLFELGIFLTVIVGFRRISFDTQFFTRFFLFYFISTTIGIGLIYSRKWAAGYFSIATLLVGLWLIIASVQQVPFPLNLINISIGIVLLLPAIITIKYWSDLSWKGKWII
ncbi:MAG: hypothetical protein K1X72_23335 [Pyrinomonadaceae bacterium]|nr:hypothetical protein [Pyrinomonadaceae bacterium]